MLDQRSGRGGVGGGGVKLERVSIRVAIGHRARMRSLHLILTIS